MRGWEARVADLPIQRWYYKCSSDLALVSGRGFVRVGIMEGRDESGRVFDVFGDFPSRRFGSVFVPLPLDEVLEAIATSPRV